ncbi:cobalt transporter CbiM [Pelagibaculum spongiae]|uniref:Cobalt transporter CbiM n=1 Tax=Pelagibaculum spongiae TaxID=2080658 RepID=A0A2V1GYX6_9GAMM|nr:cobalt transporter CbiM [Pelagibaculum spongiae]PVZ72271.1 cobalt transporter CbiM [Pelagibaculum spongiae]
MHIAEGVLSIPVLGVGIVATVAATAIGLKKIEDRQIPQAGVLSACFFVASLIHLPLGFTSVHLIFNGLIGLLLGWAAFPVILIALILQALFFGFGGIVVLGINCLNIALPAVLVGYLIRHLAYALPDWGKGFTAGFLAVFLTSLMVSLTLAFSSEGFVASAKLVVLGHLPVALIEGVVSGFALALMGKVRPGLLQPISIARARPLPQEFCSELAPAQAAKGTANV